MRRFLTVSALNVFIVASMLAQPGHAADTSTVAPDCYVQVAAAEAVPRETIPPVTVHRQIDYGGFVECNATFSNLASDEGVSFGAGGVPVSTNSVAPTCATTRQEVEGRTIWKNGPDCSWLDSSDHQYYYVTGELTYWSYNKRVYQREVRFFHGNVETGTLEETVACKANPILEQLTRSATVANVEVDRWLRWGVSGTCSGTADHADNVTAELWRLDTSPYPSWTLVDTCVSTARLSESTDDATCVRDAFDLPTSRYLVRTEFGFRGPIGTSIWYAFNYKSIFLA